MSEKLEQRWHDLCVFTENVMASHKVPGVALGILYQGEIYSTGFGVTNVNHPLPVTDDTLFQIGSITKTFTGTLIMRLVEEGKIDLDEPVRTYVPEFRVADEATSAKATVRHLLTHVGGWVGDFFHDTGAGDNALPRYVADMADLEQLAPLGSIWSYNNAGFYVAGAIIENVTGQSYQTVLKESLLDPLALNHAFLDPGDVMPHRFAVGHHLDGKTIQVAHPWPLPRAAYPVGGITCDVKDLLNYGRFCLGDGTTESGTQLLTTDSLRAMQTPAVTVWEQESWGLTWSINDTYGTRLVRHGGGTTGQVSEFMFVPEHDFAVAIFTNANQGGQVTRDVVRHVLKLYLDLDTKLPAPIKTTEAELKPYVGQYQRPYMDIEVGLLGGRLVAQITPKQGFPAQDSPPAPQPPPVALVRCGKDWFLGVEGSFKDANFRFIRKADGSIGWLSTGRLHVRQA